MVPVPGSVYRVIGKILFKFTQVPVWIPPDNRITFFPFNWKPDMAAVCEIIRRPSVSHVDECILFAIDSKNLGTLRAKGDFVFIFCASAGISDRLPFSKNFFSNGKTGSIRLPAGCPGCEHKISASGKKESRSFIRFSGKNTDISSGKIQI